MRLTIAQFDNVIFYLPVYIAKELVLKKSDLELSLISTGNDDSAIEAVCDKRADIAISDPSMAVLATNAGKPCRCIGQLAHKAPIHLITLNQLCEPQPLDKLARLLKGSTLSTYPRPSTTYTCTLSLLRKMGLTPGHDIEIIQTPYRDELGPLFSAEADFAMVNDPICTQAVGNGAKALRHLSEDFGTMTFSGLSIRSKFGQRGEEKKALSTFMHGVQIGMDIIFSDRKKSLKVAVEYFPQIERPFLEKAIAGLIESGIYTKSLKIPKQDWEQLIKLREESGELARGARQ